MEIAHNTTNDISATPQSASILPDQLLRKNYLPALRGGWREQRNREGGGKQSISKGRGKQAKGHKIKERGDGGEK